MSIDFTLPTESHLRSLEIYDYVWDDLSDGLITNEHGSVIKYFVDQMTPSQTALFREPLSGTGKTAKFVIDNVENSNNIPNLVVQDTFVNTFLFCGEFWDIVEDDPRVYQNPQIQDTILYDEAGEITGTTKTFPNGVVLDVDLTQEPEVRTKEQLTEVDSDSTQVMSRMVNVNGDALGSDDEVFSPELTVIFPFPISLGYPVHEAEGLVNTVLVSLRKTPVGGVVVLFDIHYERVNTPMWRAIDALKEIGYVFEPVWLLNSEDDESGAYKAAVIKRIQ